MLYFIKKNDLFLKVETISYESDYSELSDLDAEHRVSFTWVRSQENAVSFYELREAKTYLAKKARLPFFKGAVIIKY